VLALRHAEQQQAQVQKGQQARQGKPPENAFPLMPEVLLPHFYGGLVRPLEAQPKAHLKPA
jgi:hypothetical protein